MGPVMSTLPVPPPKLVEVPETEPENCRSGRLVMTLISPPGSRIPYSVEAGPFQDFHSFGGGVKAARQHGAQAVGHDRAVAVGAKAAAGKGVLVPPRVLVCTTLATLYSASSSEVAC